MFFIFVNWNQQIVMLKGVFILQCPKCGLELTKVFEFNICPVHGQITDAEETIPLFSVEFIRLVDELGKVMPFSLVHQFNWLNVEISKQNPIASAWQLRDCFEYLIRFLAVIELAEFFRVQRNEAYTQQIVSLLTKPQGLSLGDWWSLVDTICAYWSREDSGDQPIFPSIVKLVINERGRKTELAQMLGSGSKNVINWRNKVFGHGVFQRENSWYADECIYWINKLFSFQKLLEEVFKDLSIYVDRSQIYLTYGSKNLKLSPFVQFLACKRCNRESYYYLDKTKIFRAHNTLSTHYIDYACGDLAEVRDAPEIERFILEYIKDSGKYNWERTSYDSSRYYEWEQKLIRDFEEEYYPFPHFMQKLKLWFADNPCGYLWIKGEGGTGKSFLVEGFGRILKEEGYIVLTYRLAMGQFCDYRTFIIELAHQLRNTLSHRTQEIQAKNSQLQDLQAQFIEFVRETMLANNIDSLVLIVDGIDEIPVGQISLLNIFPPASQLPRGLYIVLSGRPSLNETANKQVNRIKGESSLYWQEITLEHSSKQYRELLDGYIRRELGDSFSQNLASKIINLSEGRFLYVYHYCQALKSRVIREDELIEDQSFYQCYLSLLNDKLGERMFKQVFWNMILVLAAAREPLELECLENWGFPREDIFLFIQQFKDFISTEFTQERLKLQIAHQNLTRFVCEDHDLNKQFQAIQIFIANKGLDLYSGQWLKIEPDDYLGNYYLKHLPYHLNEADLSGAEISSAPVYGIACYKSAINQIQARNFQSALLLLDNSIGLLKDLDIITFLESLSAKATLLKQLGSYREAIVCFTDLENEASKIDAKKYQIQALYDIMGNRKDAFADLVFLKDLLLEEKSELLAEVYLSLAWHYHFTNINQAITLVEDAVKVSVKANKDLFELKVHLMLGRAYASSGRLELAIKEYDSVWPKLASPSFDHINSDYNLRLLIIEAVVGCIDYGDYYKALQMISHINNLLDLNLLEKSYLSLWKALAYKNLGAYDQALAVLDEAIEFKKHLPSDWIELILLSLRSMVYDDLNEVVKAQELRQQAMKLAIACDDTWIMVDLKIAFAFTELKLNNIHKALVDFSDARTTAIQIGMTHAEVLSRLGIAEGSINLGLPHKAREEMTAVEKVMADYPQLPSCSEEGIWFSLFNLYVNLGDKQRAKQCFMKAEAEVERKRSLITNPEFLKTYLDTKIVRDILKEA